MVVVLHPSTKTSSTVRRAVGRWDATNQMVLVESGRLGRVLLPAIRSAKLLILSNLRAAQAIRAALHSSHGIGALLIILRWP